MELVKWNEPQNKGLGCMLVDADHFKQVNDSYGHAAGDIVLQRLAEMLKHPIRTDDIVCRLGGDEFLIICPNTDKEGLALIAAQMHEQISGEKVTFEGGCWQGSISVGLAVKSERMERPEDMIKLADNGVYAAKRAGKNCVRFGSLGD